jgi:predicted ATPase
MITALPPKLLILPTTLPIEGAVRIDLEEGIPMFRASMVVQNHIEALLAKQQIAPLNAEEEQELDCYEEIDDYLSFVNRMLRNLSLNQVQSSLE